MIAAIKKYFSTIVLFSLFACGHKDRPSGQTDTTKNDSTTFVRSQPTVNPYAAIDVSPMDMSYYPADYPKLKMSKAVNTIPLARVIYSRPHLQRRRLFYDVLKYGEPWRLGANEATELQLYKDASIQGKNVKAGRYVLYCIPQPNTWTIVLNSNIDSWGLIPDSTKDIFRFPVPSNQINQHLEDFTMIFEKTDGGAELIMAWDNIAARLPINF